MSQISINAALADALEDLSKDDFDKFCHRLLHRQDEPRVKRNKVEGKSFLQITDVLVSHFTEERAPQVALEILNQIGCSNEAKALEKRIGGQPSKPGPGDSGAGGGSKMADGKHFVDTHRLDLIRRVNNIAPILDELFDYGVVDQGVYDQVRVLPTAQDKMRDLYAKVLNAEKCKDIFYQSLLANEKFLVDELKEKK